MVLLGGAAMGHHQNSLSVPYLSKEYMTINTDVRGCGPSDRPIQKYTMDIMVNDLKALLDALGIRKTHVCAPASWPMLAIQFAAMYPNMTSSIIIGGYLIPPKKRIKRVLEAQKAMKRTLDIFAEVKEAWGEGAEYAALSAANQFPEWGKSRKFFEQYTAKAHKTNVDVRVFRLQCEMLVTTDITPYLDKVKCPCLIVHGDQGGWMWVDFATIAARELQKAIGPNAEVKVFEGQGYSAFMLENAKKWSEFVINWLKRHPQEEQSKSEKSPSREKVSRRNRISC